MIDFGLSDVEFIVANSDLQALKNSKATSKIQLGVKTTKGLGCGANPELGRRATEEDLDKIMEQLDGADIVFIVAGMGGGTGSGGAPVLAKALKKNPREVAQTINKDFVHPHVQKSEIAGPGFINFFLTQAYIDELAHQLLEEHSHFFSETSQPKKR